MESLPTLVAGGGIAGLAAALALSRFGPVVVLERESRFAESGAGLQLGPNAVAALRKLGAWDAVEPITCNPPEIYMRDLQSGKVLRRLKLGTAFEKRFGAPYRTAHRADLHRALLDCVRANGKITLVTDFVVTAYTETAEAVSIRSMGALIWNGQRLIAADGNSALRQQMFPGTEAVRAPMAFNRALAPLDAVAGVDLDCVNLWLGPGQHVVHYPVGLGAQLNLVHVISDSMTRTDAAAACCKDLQSVLASAQDWSQWPALSVPTLATWQKGKILLMGDAAHGTLPFLAQGAAMALEDAAELLTSPDRLDQRKPRTVRLDRETGRNGRIYHLGGLAAQIRNATLALAPDFMINNRLKWLYDYA